MKRFYGFSEAELNDLPVHIFNTYYLEIERVRSKEILHQFDVSAYGMAQSKDRKKIIRRYEKVLKKYEETKLSSKNDFEEFLKGL